MTFPAGSFGAHLRTWRQHRGWSQLALAHEAEVSPRHLSFLETGRAQPSREMIARLMETLEVPLRDRNAAFLAAGFAPAFGERALDDPEMAGVRQSLDFILRAHEPNPAFVLDGAWNIVLGNRPHRHLLAQLVEGDELAPPNALLLVCDPALLRPRILNWELVASVLLRRFQRQLRVPGNETRLEALRDRVFDFPGTREAAASMPSPPTGSLLLPLQLELGGQQLSFFSTLATFGTAQDVTLQELQIECQLPADAATERFLFDTQAAASAT